MADKIKIAITMGDPGGVGPEIILKALNARPVREGCVPVVVGDAGVLDAAKAALPIVMHQKFVAVKDPGEDTGNRTALIDLANVEPGELTVGRPGAYAGRAAVGYIKKAVELAMAGKVDAVVTAPINKDTLRMAGFPWPGHTELLAELTGASEYGMMLTGGGLRVMLATTHCALADVPGLINRETVARAIRLAARACEMLGIKDPKIAVAGLNPHAGEEGMFGSEEREHILPACEEAAAMGRNVTGPLSPDTVFYKAHRGEFDMVVCMYHDQGLIPLKLLAFGSAVNVTVGLPVVRTSVDHGTAYDIAGGGVASAASMIEAVKLAAQMAARKEG